MKGMGLRVYLACKRLLDISVSGWGLVLLAPVMLVIGMVVKASSPGPVFFRQKRLGEGGREFDLVKFRTMRPDAEKILHDLHEYRQREQPFVQMQTDPRIFPFGNVLRKTSLDELPQLFNVLFGQMSLVGPRPWIAADLSVASDEQRKRLQVKPGLTGLAQINGRGEVPFEKRMHFDLEYLSNRSLVFDAKILVETVKVVLTRRGAY